MTSLPLHPAIVHLPLGLAFVIPAVAAGFAWALWTGRVRPRGAWVAVIALQAVLLGAGLVAMSTGEREEERVERIVPDAAIERHEEYAEQFIWAVGLTLVAAVLVLAFRNPALVHAMAAVTVVGSLVVAAAAIRVGHAGGQLVYVHNAGDAYAATDRQTMRGAEPTAVEGRQHRITTDDREAKEVTLSPVRTAKILAIRTAASEGGARSDTRTR